MQRPSLLKREKGQFFPLLPGQHARLPPASLLWPGCGRGVQRVHSFLLHPRRHGADRGLSHSRLLSCWDSQAVACEAGGLVGGASAAACVSDPLKRFSSRVTVPHRGQLAMSRGIFGCQELEDAPDIVGRGLGCCYSILPLTGQPRLPLSC